MKSLSTYIIESGRVKPNINNNNDALNMLNYVSAACSDYGYEVISGYIKSWRRDSSRKLGKAALASEVSAYYMLDLELIILHKNTGNTLRLNGANAFTRDSETRDGNEPGGKPAYWTIELSHGNKQVAAASTTVHFKIWATGEELSETISELLEIAKKSPRITRNLGNLETGDANLLR